MKEWLMKMAKELGLAEDAAESEILAKLTERMNLDSARLSTVTAQLAAAGFKLDGEKLVKLERTSNPEDAARIAALELDNVKGKLAQAKLMAEGLIAAGKIPPAHKDALERVFASTGKLEVAMLSRSGDSEVLIKGTVDVLSDLKKIFDSIPSVTGGKMSTVGGQAGAEGAKKEAGKLGREVAQRNQPKRKEPAAQ